MPPTPGMMPGSPMFSPGHGFAPLPGQGQHMHMPGPPQQPNGSESSLYFQTLAQTADNVQCPCTIQTECVCLTFSHIYVEHRAASANSYPAPQFMPPHAMQYNSQMGRPGPGPNQGPPGGPGGPGGPMPKYYQNPPQQLGTPQHAPPLGQSSVFTPIQGVNADGFCRPEQPSVPSPRPIRPNTAQWSAASPAPASPATTTTTDVTYSVERRGDGR